ncbi:MAG TPA: sodium-dependent transporter [Acidobacteriota bacterium]|nr:sodium-dependent transporter [Acidobacteriota bacterium]
MTQQRELFSSRWALILAALGMAVGTGNIWRFPRIIAKVGGGAFIIPWLLFLFLWSIPLLLLEFGLGRGTRKGCIGAVGTLIGEKFAWLGGFVALCSTAIMFYYSVVTGWCLKYLFASISGALGEVTSADQGLNYFVQFSSSWEPLLFHLLAIGICALIVWRGVTGGIERANKIIIPSLLIILLISLWRALTLPGAERGLQFLFTPHWETLLDYRTWLEALTQSAWSVGAGWGLLLTYAVYMKKREDVTVNSLVIGLGDYSASLLAALIIIPTAFALIPAALPGGADMTAAQQFGETVKVIQAAPPYEHYNPASTGLTFVFIPALLNSIQAEFGVVFMVIFFLALTMAAVSSLIAMVELATRILMDAGMPRKKSILLVGTAGFFFGVPSALNMSFFENQDWVWGVGLIVSGLFLSITAIKYGVDRFRRELINVGPGIKLGRWFNLLIAVVLPLEFLALIAWWFYQTAGEDWWNPFAVANPGTCLFQWGVAIIFLIIVNRPLARRSVRGEMLPGITEE